MKLVVLGAGESGVGTALLAQKKGLEVFVSDYGAIAQKYKDVLLHHDIVWEENQHSLEEILTADLVVKSPGISPKVAVVIAIKEKGIPVISEIEFAARYTNATLVGITGSNGKTTTATLAHYILANGGLNVALGGNIGESMAGLVAKAKHDYMVIELSSFQLEDIEDFKPKIAVLTNISPDHLDRYEYKLENYVAAKFQIAKNQDASDYFIYDADDLIIQKWLQDHPIQSHKLPFSLTKKLDEGAYLENKNLIITVQNKTQIMSIASLGLEGQHNVKNAMAAATVATLLQIRKETIRESMEHFQGVEHRLEKVLKINNVMYINDSKATNINATFYALDSMESPTVWIVGGIDKGNEYEELLPLVNEKVKAIICLGLDNTKIIQAFGNVVELMVETHSMSDAVQVAYRIAERGDTVLLSPACASFDLFENYEDRGRQFKGAVRHL
jgi:UDP-N-acetylmuramoylalanine--D-glutamate ligase